MVRYIAIRHLPPVAQLVRATASGNSGSGGSSVQVRPGDICLIAVVDRWGAGLPLEAVNARAQGSIIIDPVLLTSTLSAPHHLSATTLSAFVLEITAA